MGYKFYSDETIEYPFFIEMGNERGGQLRKDLFSRKEYFDRCRCPSCGKSKAVMKRSRRNDAYLLLCPVETCSLKSLTLHDLIKRQGLLPCLRSGGRRVGKPPTQRTGCRLRTGGSDLVTPLRELTEVKCVRSCSSLVCSLCL